jgi:hypothetical protein
VYSEDEIKEAHLDDFRVFLSEVWAFLGLPKPTPVQLDIAKYLQHGPRRSVVEAFRGVGKSWITVAFAIWLLFLDPQLKIEVVSANEDTAKAFTTFTQTIIKEMPLCQWLRPRQGQRDSALAFDVGPATPSKDPSMKSVGITGQITGSRADVIIPDDIEVPKNSYTPVQRERLAELVKEFDSVLKPGGRVRYLGTPHTEQSLYNRLPQRGYDVRIWTAEIPKFTEKYGTKLAPFIHRLIGRGAKPGDPVDPLRFDRQDLDERLLSEGRSGYALQYMLDTSAADGDRFPLKLNDLIVTDVDRELGYSRLVWGGSRDLYIPDLESGGLDNDLYVGPAWKSAEMQPWQGTVMAIDPSGRGKDETAYAIVRLLNAQLYLVEVGGFKDGFAPETLKALAVAAIRNRVNYVITERNYGGGMFDSLFRPVLIETATRARMDPNSPDPAARPPRIDDEWDGWVSTQKEPRILDIMEPLTQQHRLCVDRRCIEADLDLLKDDKRQAYSWVYQYTRLFRERGALAHDDRIEAISMACSYWTEKLDRDQAKLLEDRKTHLLEKEIETFVRQAKSFGVNGCVNIASPAPTRRWTSRPV